MRSLLPLALFAALPALAARDFIDDAGRNVALPDKVTRVYAAGPPASVLVFALAPDTLVGWTRGFRPDEAAWIPEKYAKLPELGRLTGRGNTANVEAVLQARPDLIVDMGSTNATFASLADRVQQQTGIPYILLDGRLSTTTQQIEKLATALGVEARGKELSAYAGRVIEGLRSKIAAVPDDKRPRVYLSPHLPFGWFDYPPGPNRLVGLLWLSEILYPGEFRHDLRKEVATFYKLFYHREPAARQLDALLGEPGVAPR